MRFYTLSERKPLEGQTVLAKIDNSACGVDYYVLDYTTVWDWEGVVKTTEQRFTFYAAFVHEDSA